MVRRWLALGFLGGCAATAPLSGPFPATPLPAACEAGTDGASRVGYFPRGVFDEERPDIDDFDCHWYTDQLVALGGPALYPPGHVQPRHSYRFLWLRSFHHPIAIRLDVADDGSGTLTVKETSGAGGYEPGRLIVDRRRAVSATEVRRFYSLLDELQFWRLLATPKIPPNGVIRIGFDGAAWILEGIRGQEYQLAFRWAPRNKYFVDDEKFADAAWWLVEQARLTIPADEIY